MQNNLLAPLCPNDCVRQYQLLGTEVRNMFAALAERTTVMSGNALTMGADLF